METDIKKKSWTR